MDNSYILLLIKINELVNREKSELKWLKEKEEERNKEMNIILFIPCLRFSHLIDLNLKKQSRLYDASVHQYIFIPLFDDLNFNI